MLHVLWKNATKKEVKELKKGVSYNVIDLEAQNLVQLFQFEFLCQNKHGPWNLWWQNQEMY